MALELIGISELARAAGVHEDEIRRRVADGMIRAPFDAEAETWKVADVEGFVEGIRFARELTAMTTRGAS